MMQVIGRDNDMPFVKSVFKRDRKNTRFFIKRCFYVYCLGNGDNSVFCRCSRHLVFYF